MIISDKPGTIHLASYPKIIRKRVVQELTGLSESSIWRREHEGTFPHRVNLGGRAVGWRYEEVIAWLEQRAPTRS